MIYKEKSKIEAKAYKHEHPLAHENKIEYVLSMILAILLMVSYIAFDYVWFRRA